MQCCVKEEIGEEKCERKMGSNQDLFTLKVLQILQKRLSGFG